MVQTTTYGAPSPGPRLEMEVGTAYLCGRRVPETKVTGARIF